MSCPKLSKHVFVFVLKSIFILNIAVLKSKSFLNHRIPGPQESQQKQNPMGPLNDLIWGPIRAPKGLHWGSSEGL
jgi:hypothetical protein